MWSISSFLPKNRKLVHVDVSTCVSEVGGRGMVWWQYGRESRACTAVPQKQGPEELCHGLKQPAPHTYCWRSAVISEAVQETQKMGASLSAPRNLHHLHKNYVKNRTWFPVKYKSTCILHELEHWCKNGTHPKGEQKVQLQLWITQVNVGADWERVWVQTVVLHHV